MKWRIWKSIEFTYLHSSSSRFFSFPILWKYLCQSFSLSLPLSPSIFSSPLQLTKNTLSSLLFSTHHDLPFFSSQILLLYDITRQFFNQLFLKCKVSWTCYWKYLQISHPPILLLYLYLFLYLFLLLSCLAFLSHFQVELVQMSME